MIFSLLKIFSEMKILGWTCLQCPSMEQSIGIASPWLVVLEASPPLFDPKGIPFSPGMGGGMRSQYVFGPVLNVRIYELF